MTDADLRNQLHTLVSQGPQAAKQLNEIVRSIGLAKLISLIPKPRAKTVRLDLPTFLPDDFPDEKARALATDYWTRNGRPDLVATISRIVDDFRAHHGNPECPTKAKSWSRTWTTWYRNQVNFVRPARGSAQGVLVAFEEASVDRWVRRLEVFYSSGEWSPDRWGSPPEALGCRVPPDAIAAYVARHGARQKA